jgi:Tfp pilus assembly protein PilV
MVIIRRGHIKATSLMETLAAMIITVVAFSAGFMIFQNVLQSRNTAPRAHARQQISQLASLSNADALSEEEPSPTDLFHIEKSVKPYKDYPNVDIITWTAKDANGKELFVQHKLIYRYEE